MKRKQLTFTEMVSNAMQARTFEPVARVKCLEHVPRGWRNRPEQPRHVRHRFPIKGGIRGADVMIASITQNNVLLHLLSKRK